MTSVDERTLTLDDFIQLQAILSYEQEVRSKHIELCAGNHSDGILEQHDPVHAHRHTHFRRALDPQAAVQSKLEQARLAEALLKLKWLKEQYRRERAMEIQSYLEYYRRQALIRAVLQEEEERYYRQCIAAALEQRRIQVCLQQFLDIKRHNELQLQFEKQQLSEEEEQQVSDEQEDENDGYTEYHSKQLQAFLIHIFNFDNQEESDIACKKYPESEEQQAMSMAEVWKCLSDQKAKEETPRSAFLSSDHDALLGSTSIPVQEKEEDVNSDEQIIPKIESKKEDTESNFPPVQDHVVSLQDLIQQLASQPVLVDNMHYSDEPKPSGIWANQTQQPVVKQSPPPPPLNLKDSPVMQHEEPEEKEEPKPYLPQHIFTDAEPTPKLESMPDTPVKDEEEEEKKKSFLPQHIFTEAEPTPKLEHSPSMSLTPQCEEEEDQDVQHFVDSIAAEQKNEIVPPDPRKVKAYEELDAISKQLIDEQSDLVKRWKHVLERGNKQTLSFHKQKEGTLLLTASTDFNREFLGAEDELTRLMLRFDAVDSLGDNDIRQKRKNLVKKCESMLEKLDTFKQSQWEKAMKQQR